MWKLRKFSLTFFWQKFRESNVLLNKEITKALISRKKKLSEREFLDFPHCVQIHFPSFITLHVVITIVRKSNLTKKKINYCFIQRKRIE